MDFKTLSIREKQAIGAFCLKAFCDKYRINHNNDW